jgi:hypothetical protein
MTRLAPIVSSLLLVRTLPVEVHDALMLAKPASAA